MKKVILITFGSLSLAVGAVGIFLPLLPTTPFVLIAAGCYGGSSPRLYRWLSRSKYFGEFLDNYHTKAGVSKGVKQRALVFLWGSLAISALIIQRLHVCIILGIVGVCVSAHILLLKTKRE